MALTYQKGILHLGGAGGRQPLNLQEVAECTDGPFYVYDLDAIEGRYQLLDQQLGDMPHQIHYALKANMHPKIVQALAKLGAGADVVSCGEMKFALENGVDASRVIFSGVGKTKSELREAIGAGIKQINVESIPELERIAKLAKEMKKRARVAFRLNPDVNPITHPYITTGFRENKFGMDFESIPALETLIRSHPDTLEFVGLTMHIGSQLLDLSALEEGLQKITELYQRLKNNGYPLQTLDVGGGLGIFYETDESDREIELIHEYAELIRKYCQPLQAEILVEPGRMIVARSGVLVGEVQYVKKTANKTFLILDTGMNHLMRPSLYQAFHRILPVQENSDRGITVYDVVGPICESSDVLGKDRALREVAEGEYLAIADTGAYGYSMASHYNAHALPTEYIWSKGNLSK